MTSKNTVEIKPATTMVSTKLRPVVVLLLFLVTVRGIQAQPQPSLDSEPKAVTVTFRLEPSSATVWRQTGEGHVNALGRSDQPVTIGLTEQEASGSRDLLIHFKVDLWFGEWTSPPEFIPVQDLMTHRTFPSDGRRQLGLSGWELFQARTTEHPRLTMGILLSIFCVSGLFVRYRKSGRFKPEESLIPGYTVVRKLGQGGMGVVHEVQDGEGQRFAVKLLKTSASAGPEFQRQFDHELSVGGRLRHPNLPRLFGYGVASDGRAYMITELFEGQTLKERLESGGVVRSHLAAEVLEQVGSALDYLHRSDLVHQDVKPSNIYCCHDGTLKLLDLGIAKSLSSGSDRTKVVGSPIYMAPEQFSGASEPASDQYSLGLVLYEILMKRKPTDTRDPTVLAHQRSAGRPDPTGLGDALDQSLLRMLSPRASDRFEDLESARQVLTDELMALPPIVDD